MSILVDTDAWYAVANRSDRRHEDARDFHTEHAPRGLFVTTALIVAETWTLISSRTATTTRPPHRQIPAGPAR